ncbi:MAG: DUF4190 domain-containing protein [Candidatus Nanopelagicales bacterium]|nr:DUF4190 domain-containing protein [Candidatus Nanopelagicales bacterium]
MAAPQNGLGTAALIMGILQFFCLGTIGSILAIIFGRIGMKKADQGLATNRGSAKAGFILGIVGIILSVLGIILAIILVVFGAKAINDSVDPVQNTKTGLVDGNYGMNPTGYTRINDRCSYSGLPVDVNTQATGTSDVTVVGEGSSVCPSEMSQVAAVLFDVKGGVASIVEVQ